MRTVSGLLLPFNVEVERWWGKLTFLEGCFDEFLGEDRVYGRDVTWGADHMMWAQKVVAREANNTLRFYADEQGLHWTAELVDGSVDGEQPTSAQRDMAALLDQQLGLCVSAGTLIYAVDWREMDTENEIGAVLRAGLSEMSTVVSPAFLKAKAHKYSYDGDAGGDTVASVVEFGALDGDGKRVDFDFVADRERARAELAAQQAQTEPEPAPPGPTVTELLSSPRYRGVTQ